MHHFMRQRILQMTSRLKMVCADQDTILRVKASALLFRTSFTVDVVGCDGCAAVGGSEQVDVVLHEADDGGVLEEPFFVRVAAFAVALFVEGVFDVEVFLAVAGRGVAGEDGEEVGPGVEGCVKFGFGLGRE